jgi:hypothetical protein
MKTGTQVILTIGLLLVGGLIWAVWQTWSSLSSLPAVVALMLAGTIAGGIVGIYLTYKFNIPYWRGGKLTVVFCGAAGGTLALAFAWLAGVPMTP